MSGQPTVHAEDARASLASRAITGSVRNQDLRRVPQAIVQIKDQEGNTVAETVSDLAGDFTVQVPGESAYSVSATQEDLRSEYVIIKVGADQPAPVKLTLGPSKELALEVVAPLPPL
ncbi:MAG: carboxypeptidase-like regulatory domain-containing protein [Nitrospirota bacterium]